MAANKNIKIFSAQQLEAEGKDYYQKKDYQAAVENFKAAAESYIAIGDELKAVEMKNNQSVTLLQDKKPQLAWDAVADTVDVFREAGDERRQAMALGNRAAASEVIRKFEDAIEDYQAAADIFEKLGENELRLNTMQSLSALQLRRGNSLEAISTMQAGVKNVKGLSLRQKLLKLLMKIPSKLMPK